MPAIDDLLRLRRCLDGRLSIGRPAITADEFDTRMIIEPFLYGFGITAGQEIDDVASLKVHDDRAVPLAFELGPVVDPNESGRRRGFVLKPIDPAQQRVWEGGHGEQTGEAGAGFTSQSQPNCTVGLLESVGRSYERTAEQTPQRARRRCGVRIGAPGKKNVAP
ncbi:MAG: hypothetical protein P4L84_01590 [Isosphaeraceae bacterium]|nr:hypothetical protein [Isosphaeraceae bacterium]